MTVKELTLTDNYEIVHLGDPEAVISEPYCCDLLSIAMGNAPAASAWCTVMSNMNTLAAYLMPHPTSVQVDTDRSSVEEIIASLEQQGITVRRNEQVERALFLSGYEALDEIEEFENGLLYVQDTASMLAVESGRTDKMHIW